MSKEWFERWWPLSLAGFCFFSIVMVLAGDNDQTWAFWMWMSGSLFAVITFWRLGLHP